MINKLRWWVIFLLLRKKERSALYALCHARELMVANYAECMGETFHEFQAVFFELKHSTKTL